MCKNNPKTTFWKIGLSALLVSLAGVGTTIAANGIGLNLDYAVFYSRHSGPYIEIYYGFEREGLVPVSKNDKEVCEAVVSVGMKRDQAVVLNDIWRMQVDMSDSSSQTARVVDMVRYPVEPGDYRLSFYVTDANNLSSQDSAVVDVHIPSFAEKQVEISDIELAANIKRAPADAKSNFTKSKLEVIPNPGNVYGENRPMLFFYVEAYNLLSGIQGDKYTTRYWLSDDENRNLQELPAVKRIKAKRVDASVEVGTLNVSTLPTGIYNFNFAIGEADGTPVRTGMKKIYVFNGGTAPVASQGGVDWTEAFAASEFASMDEKELQQEFDYLQYLINTEGKEFFQSLKTLDAKRRFLFDFWKAKDPDPTTPVNENRQEYLARIEYANKHFRRMGKEGWRTDRGRVYLVYGRPDYIDRFPSTAGSKPYEIWNYNDLEGGSEFVFIDDFGFGEYVLVHSDVTGEPKNENWRLRAQAQPIRQ